MQRKHEKRQVKGIKKDHDILGLRSSMLHLTSPPILSVDVGKVVNAKDAQKVITSICLQFSVVCGNLYVPSNSLQSSKGVLRIQL